MPQVSSRLMTRDEFLTEWQVSSIIEAWQAALWQCLIEGREVWDVKSRRPAPRIK